MRGNEKKREAVRDLRLRIDDHCRRLTDYLVAEIARLRAENNHLAEKYSEWHVEALERSMRPCSVCRAPLSVAFDGCDRCGISAVEMVKDQASVLSEWIECCRSLGRAALQSDQTWPPSEPAPVVPLEVALDHFDRQIDNILGRVNADAEDSRG